MKHTSQDLESLALGPLPIINHFLRRLRLEDLLRQALAGRERRQKLGSARALGVFLRNMLVSRQPLYALPEWAAGYVPETLGLQPGEEARLNDDRVGRCLDRLFEADRASLLTSFVLRMVQEFDLAALHSEELPAGPGGSKHPTVAMLHNGRPSHAGLLLKASIALMQSTLFPPTIAVV